MAWIDAVLSPLSLPDVAALPFSFVLGGEPSARLMQRWRWARKETRAAAETHTTCAYTDPTSGLRVTCQVRAFEAFPACAWLLSVENTGDRDTPVMSDILPLDYAFTCPMVGDPEADMGLCDQLLPSHAILEHEQAPYVLHRTNGAPSNPGDFEMARIALGPNAAVTLGGGGGRSSNRDFPFFRVDTGRGAAIVAVGWSGQWQASIAASSDGAALRVRCGMEHARFYLRPGERVRMPSILVLLYEGERREANARFRRLIHRHYVPTYQGAAPDAFLFCNTAFTRRGVWLNQCNAQNQISLIRALRPLGVEAVITDAGWFKGGWPRGAGNWDPDPEKYPNGMAPVAKAASEIGARYGLWFEPERVVAGTAVDVAHPEWVLWRKDEHTTGLLDFGRAEVQDYFLEIVGRLMSIPGFGCYRQDFNMDPLQWWLDNDAPDRVGITEARYVEGLYHFWDRLAEAYPDAIRENCASGGRRIDLEAIQRFHFHQKSDLWFHNVTDQSSLFALSQYLPNGVLSTPIDRMDVTTFHSVLPSSISLGWIADAPDFDYDRAVRLCTRFRELRPLLAKDWYPLTPFSRALTSCLGSQYHSPEDAAGMILLFRRAHCPYPELEVSLAGLDPAATYRLAWEVSGRTEEAPGAALMDGFRLALPPRGESELITYRRV